MTKQFKRLAETEDIMGWLNWWTITSGEFDLQRVADSAQVNGVPQYIQDKLSGRDIESAWKTATQLGVAGKPVGSAGKMLRRLITRNAVPGEGNIRAIVMEETDPTWETEKWVTAKTACILELKGSRFSVDWADWVDQDPYASDIREVISEMKDKMYRIEGKVNDGRIRAALLAWLDIQHRVTVRGSGGVYFIPHAKSSEHLQMVEESMISIMAWLKDACSSLFSVVALHEDGVYSKENFIEDATSEIKDEVKEISGKIKIWKENDNMNAGSKHYSAGTQVLRIEELQEKVRALKESLGMEIGIVDEMVSIVKKQLESMMVEASRVMDVEKTERIQRRKEAREQKKRGANSTSGKKSGTAKSRQKKTAFA